LETESEINENRKLPQGTAVVKSEASFTAQNSPPHNPHIHYSEWKAGFADN